MGKTAHVRWCPSLASSPVAKGRSAVARRPPHSRGHRERKKKRDILFAVSLSRVMPEELGRASGRTERQRNWPMPSAQRPSSMRHSGRPSPSCSPGGVTCAILAPRGSAGRGDAGRTLPPRRVAPSVGNCQPTGSCASTMRRAALPSGPISRPPTTRPSGHTAASGRRFTPGSSSRA